MFRHHLGPEANAEYGPVAPEQFRQQLFLFDKPGVLPLMISPLVCR